MRQDRILTFPSEHGAYIILLAAWLWGVIFSTVVRVEGSVLVLAVALTLFLSQESVRRLLRARTARLHPVIIGTLLLSLATSVLLIVRYPSVMYVTVPTILLGLLYFLIARKKVSPYTRSAIGFTLLSLIAPATMLANNEAATADSILVWLGVACFATSSVLVVGIRLDQANAFQRALWFHIAYGIGSILLLLSGSISLALCMLSVVAIMRYVIVVATRNAYRSLPLKVVGILESIVTVIALLSAAFL